MRCKSTLERLLAVAIAHVEGASTPELAARLQVSQKTIHRDRDFLRDRLLVEVEYDRHGRRWRAKDAVGTLPLVKTLAVINGGTYAR